MSKRKFDFKGFAVQKKPSFETETRPLPQRLYMPSPTRRVGAAGAEGGGVGPAEHSDEDEEEDRRLGAAPQREDSGENEGGIRAAAEGEDEDVDPLDAFMEGIHEEVKKTPDNPKPERKADLDEEEDPMEDYLRSHRDAGLYLAADAMNAGYNSDEEVYAAAKAVDDGNVEYDDDDNVIVTSNSKKVEPLPPVDHDDIDYPPFVKPVYQEGASISGMSDEEVRNYGTSLSIRVFGTGAVRPVKQFADLRFDSTLMNAISKQGYEKPTPIQCQVLPIVLSGRDIVGIAKTGSGKTAAFVLPLIVHIMRQAELEKGEGPIGVICSPTRELAQQIYSETKKFAKVYGIRVSGIYGGMSKFEQLKELKAGCEIVVATPGRLIDMLKSKAMTMLHGTYLVLDEADRMFDLGFEPQIRSIVGQMRPDRQTMLFSATMPRRVERLVSDILCSPIRVVAGEVGLANEDITQVATVFPSDVEKLPWLLNRLPGMIDEGDILVFASTKVRVEELESKLREKGFKVSALHGDKDQASRMEVLKNFKAGVVHILVATDVAARGLDIKSIKAVVNYDIAKDMDSHVHRIGRTGRAGDKDGVAYTLITQKESRFGGELVNSLIAAGQEVPLELMDLAMKDGRFRMQREGKKGGKGQVRGGSGRAGQGSHGGGGGRSVRGVDFGMGIGYSAGSSNRSSQSSSQPAQPAGGGSRSAAVGTLKMGMMARFKNSFVAASPDEKPPPSGRPSSEKSQFQAQGLHAFRGAERDHRR